MEDDKSVGKTIAKLNVLEGDGERISVSSRLEFKQCG